MPVRPLVALLPRRYAPRAGMCRIHLRRCRGKDCFCNVLYVPGGPNECPTILHMPKTKMGGRPTRVALTRGKVVALTVNVRNVPRALPSGLCTGLDGNMLGGCTFCGLSDGSRCCCHHMCANYVHTLSFLYDLPRCSKRGLNIVNKDRNNTLTVIATKLSSQIGTLMTFCPTLYSIANCLRKHTKK